MWIVQKKIIYIKMKFRQRIDFNIPCTVVFAWILICNQHKLFRKLNQSCPWLSLAQSISYSWFALIKSCVFKLMFSSSSSSCRNHSNWRWLEVQKQCLWSVSQEFLCTPLNFNPVLLVPLWKIKFENMPLVLLKNQEIELPHARFLDQAKKGFMKLIILASAARPG